MVPFKVKVELFTHWSSAVPDRMVSETHFHILVKCEKYQQPLFLHIYILPFVILREEYIIYISLLCSNKDMHSTFRKKKENKKKKPFL